MSTKSKMCLVVAPVALIASLVLKFAFAAIDLSDFSVGLSAAVMIGGLFTWKERQGPTG